MASKYVVKVSCHDKEDAMKLGCQIHEQLIDNPNARSSYMNDNIKLSFIGQEGDVCLFIDGVDEVPEITLFKKENK